MTSKILIIDNLFNPNLRNTITNGAQKFTRNQFHLLNRIADTYYITAEGSDPQFANQFILKERFDVNLPDKLSKIAQTKRISQEIQDIILKLNPDIVLDSSCKHMSSAWDTYPAGIIFEHYYAPSMPLQDDAKDKFMRKGVMWCGVSKWQNKQFRNFFDDTVNIHYIDEIPENVVAHKDYGIFVGRWDGGKKPHVALKNYAKSGATVPVKCYIKITGQVIPEKELQKLQDNPLFEFHIDAPREDILEAISGAAFGLGSGNESTGIVCLEYATRGVPYIVPGRGDIAEREHLPDDAIFLVDRGAEESMPSQVAKHVDFCMKLGYDYRKDLSDRVIDTYNADRFVSDHERIIAKAKNEFAKGTLDAFI